MQNTITIKNINTMSIQEQKIYSKTLKKYLNNLQITNNLIQKEIFYISNLLQKISIK